MKLLSGAIDFLFGGPAVGGADEERLRRWLAMPPASLVVPHGRARYVVVAVEASGAGTRRERLLSIHAAAVENLRIDLSGCFGAVLRQRRPAAAADAVAHGIGGQAQLEGAEPVAAMLGFLEYAGRAPLVAFQAGPVSGVVERAVRSVLGAPFAAPWLDLAALLPALHPEAGCATLAQWLERCGLAEGPRGGAPASPIAVAQLLQSALDAATRAGRVNAWQLAELQQAPHRTDPRGPPDGAA
jgi:DNA polymerase III subunit epsilon